MSTMLQDKIKVMNSPTLFNAINLASQKSEGKATIYGVTYNGPAGAKVYLFGDEKEARTTYKQGQLLIDNGNVNVVRQCTVTVQAGDTAAAV